ncbi:hypothetical protein [Schleiferilactobacillus perolens]|jgi:hypothetical protein|uniref:hypothetical protein n=1 Tax=Schleiferilactobacillus perolens TaxID=100468 RepID=UPI002354EB48|nr:hypothetical protein [Schleiferilactobacillus perolens]MCI2170077.1 hypothetical protein [Schleiferilactobacillus perolens]
MANEYEKWAAEFTKENGREPTFSEYLAYKETRASAITDDSQQTTAPDQRVKDFVTKNGRQPTFAEYRAHQQEAADPLRDSLSPTADDDNIAEKDGATGDTRNTAALSEQPPVPIVEKNMRNAKHHSWRAPLFTALLIMLITAGSAISYGWFTHRDQVKLEKLYATAIRDKNATALLQLFPSDQTHSSFAKDGAKQIIQAKIPFKKIANQQVAGLAVKQRSYWLFFRHYYLSTQLTALRISKEYKNATITYQKRPMKAKQINDNPLFWGQYTFKVQPKTIKTQKTITVTLAGGEKKSVVLPGKAAVASAQPVDPNKWQTGVPKTLQKVYFQKVSSDTSDMGNYTLNAVGTDTTFSITGGPGDGTTLERAAYRTIAKNLYIVRGQTPLDGYKETYYIKVKYEDSAHGQRLAVYKATDYLSAADSVAEAEKSTRVEQFDARTIVAPKGRVLEIYPGSFLRLNADFTYTTETVKDKPWAAMIGGGRWYFDGNEIKGDRQHIVMASFSTEDDYRAGRPYAAPIQEKSEDKLTDQNAYSFVISTDSSGQLEYRPDDQTDRVYPIKFGEHNFSDEQQMYEKWLKNSPGQGSSD